MQFQKKWRFDILPLKSDSEDYNRKHAISCRKQGSRQFPKENGRFSIESKRVVSLLDKTHDLSRQTSESEVSIEKGFRFKKSDAAVSNRKKAISDTKQTIRQFLGKISDFAFY